MLNPAFLHHLREHALLLKYLAACLCSVGKKAEELQKVSIGKAIGPFDIPLTDFEKEYLEDLAEEEDYEKSMMTMSTMTMMSMKKMSLATGKRKQF